MEGNAVKHSQLRGVGGGLVPKSIVKGQLEAKANIGDAITLIGGHAVLSGACTAGVLKTILSITGRGAISGLFLASVDTTFRTHRVKITLDGVVVFDSTTSVVYDQAVVPVIGAISVAGPSGSPVGIVENPIMFDQSLLVEYATSVTENDKTKFVYTYYTR